MPRSPDGQRDPSVALLRNLKATYKGTVLLGPIQRHVLRRARGGDPERDTSVMHVSEVVKSDWCPRNSFYRLSGTPTTDKPENRSFRMTNVLTEGSTIHDKYQTWMHEMGVLFGNWRCRDCHLEFTADRPSECLGCGSPRLRYREVHLRRDDMRIVGHADAGVTLEDVDPFLVEIKSIGLRSLAFEAPLFYERFLEGESVDNLWRDIKRPFPSHLRQGLMYCWMLGLSRIVFIYEWKPTQDVKEFVVTFHPRMVEAILQDVEEVNRCLRTSIEPDRPAWATGPDGPTCASCEYRSRCWEVDGGGAAAEETVERPRVVRSKAATRKRAFARRA